MRTASDRVFWHPNRRPEHTYQHVSASVHYIRTPIAHGRMDGWTHARAHTHAHNARINIVNILVWAANTFGVGLVALFTDPNTLETKSWPLLRS